MTPQWINRINSPAKLLHRCRRLWQQDCIFWKRYKKRIIYWTIILFHVVGVFSSIQAVMKTRTPQGAIAWAVSLNTFPYLAVPAYWIFGDSEFDAYVKSREKARESGKNITNQLADNLRHENLIAENTDSWAKVLQKLAETPFTVNNSAEFLMNGDQTYKSLLAGINRAQSYVLFQFYIIRDDIIGREFRDALVKKAKQGVQVYAMYDEVGSLDLPDSFKAPLVKAGGQFIPFNTTQGSLNRFRLNFRNHRKVMVVDGKEAWVGGINIGDEYSNSIPSESDTYLRDTHIHMTGPIVQMVQSVFMQDWYWAAKNLPKLNWKPEPSSTGSLKMLCLPSGPSADIETCALFYLSAINKAEKRIWISTPYFVPDHQIISALTLAALRGVDVRILIPKKTDSALVNLSHLGIMGEIKNSGVKIYSYQKGFIHQKVMLVDDQYSFVGTANFDNRSFRLNFEITMVTDDHAFAARTEEMLKGDFANSRLVKEDKFEKSNFFKRLFARTALLLAPVQ